MICIVILILMCRRVMSPRHVFRVVAPIFQLCLNKARLWFLTLICFHSVFCCIIYFYIPNTKCHIWWHSILFQIPTAIVSFFTFESEFNFYVWFFLNESKINTKQLHTLSLSLSPIQFSHAVVWHEYHAMLLIRDLSYLLSSFF